jgi:hypothetical protein
MGRVADKLEILDLIGRYSHAADGSSPEAYADVFTEDGVFHGRAGQPDELILRGRDKLLAFHRRAMQQRGTRQTRHHQSTTIFLEIGDDRAITRTYLLTTTAAQGVLPQMGLTSIYEDEMLKTAEGWRIKYRKIYPDVKGILQEIRKN